MPLHHRLFEIGGEFHASIKGREMGKLRGNSCSIETYHAIKGPGKENAGRMESEDPEKP